MSYGYIRVAGLAESGPLSMALTMCRGGLGSRRLQNYYFNAAVNTNDIETSPMLLGDGGHVKFSSCLLTSKSSVPF